MKLFTSTLLLLLLVASQAVSGQGIQWKNIQTGTGASFRGLSVVDDSVAWVSGSKGWIGRSTNGGNDWEYRQVKGFETCDFRSLYAFDALRAVIANAGSPAYILVTADGGQSWKQVYSNTDTAAFFDGIDFRDSKSGLIYGDPVNGRLMVLRTTDGGLTWKELPEESRPVMEKGEASFAASGTAIRYTPNGKIIIATGGTVSRLLTTTDNGLSWAAVKTPIIQGLASTGMFSVACHGEQELIIAGGDYKRDTLRTNHIFLSRDGGKSWKAPSAPTRGYRECVEYITAKTVVATGPGGTDISYDGGIHWQPLSEEKLFHVIRKSRSGRPIIMAGGDGKISVLKL